MADRLIATTRVVDASALVDLLAQRANAPAIERELAGSDWIAPAHVDVEVLSALRRMERRQVVSTAYAGRAVRDLGSVRLVRLPTVGLVDAIWRARHNLTSSDAAYVALAASVGCAVVTTDRHMQAPSDLPVEIICVRA